jgi:hypothetical protein
MSNDDIMLWTTDEIISTAVSLGVDTSSTRIVGVFYQGGVSGGMPYLTGGGEYVNFLGVDLVTGQKVVAHYGGLTVFAGASIGRFGYSGGAFGFTGSADSLSGWSVAAALSSGVTSGVSITLSDNPEYLYFAGGTTAIGVGGGGGYTWKVIVDGATIYNFGTITFRGTGEFGGSDYGEALSYVENGHGPAVVSWQYEDNGVTYTVTQTFQSVGRLGDGTVGSGPIDLVDAA